MLSIDALNGQDNLETWVKRSSRFNVLFALLQGISHHDVGILAWLSSLATSLFFTTIEISVPKAMTLVLTTTA
jgi:hypothetical protein